MVVWRELLLLFIGCYCIIFEILCELFDFHQLFSRLVCTLDKQKWLDFEKILN